ncbi:GNAT family N-acetyltransferase [Fusobacterium perfoetens]|uniref:GNAT family N-acetyltransferase n=1 Tax=Fusobacterium perfoetens TaxID=852 RepID=UPI001F31B541|nr:GNAT family protein [Fusobacterium perfoetens]MCF2626327.1 GNAT family N-acetyltransferase [Fusobacterium perfoetens]
MEKFEFILKNTQKIIIKKARENDAEEFLKYFNNVGVETDFLGFGAEGPKITLEEEKKIFKNSTSKNFYLIAELGGKIIGSCSISTNEKRLRSLHFGELGIVVLKDYWNIGIGYHLISVAIMLSKKAGLRKINLDTRIDNLRAINLYKKLGFKEEGVITRGTFINNKFYDLLIMGLEIN